MCANKSQVPQIPSNWIPELPQKILGRTSWERKISTWQTRTGLVSRDWNLNYEIMISNRSWCSLGRCWFLIGPVIRAVLLQIELWTFLVTIYFTSWTGLSQQWNLEDSCGGVFLLDSRAPWWWWWWWLVVVYFHWWWWSGFGELWWWSGVGS